MHIRNLVSPIALAAALSFSGGALAQQPMMDGVQIPAEDLPEVQAYCENLAATELESSVDMNADDDADDDDGAANVGADNGDADDGDAGDGDADDGDNDDNETNDDDDDFEASGLTDALTTIDLETVSIEDCREADLID